MDEPGTPSRRETGLVALVLALPALLLQLAGPVPRIDADAVEYYAHLRSLYFDHDLDFENEFRHFGILDRADKRLETPTGHRRTNFSIGPALMWLPFYAVGDVVARLRGDVADGYSVSHIRAAMLGSLVWGLLGLLIVHRMLRRLFDRGVAFWTIFLLFYATFLYWYLIFDPLVSHAGSFFFGALVVWIWWEAGEDPSPVRCLLLGLLIGLGSTVRWQNGLLLLFPALLLLPRLRAQPRRTLITGGATLAAFALGTLPQLLAWLAVFGSLPIFSPVQGNDYLRLDHPYLLNTFFSSRHGLLYWTPVLWGGFLGYLLLRRRLPRRLPGLLLTLAAMSWVNASSADWWGGGGFSGRRFDSVMPQLAVGLAAVLERLRRLAGERPGLVLGAGGAALVLWNFLFMQQYVENRIPRDDTVSFAQVAQNSADILTEWVGTPFAWPANWIFAWRHDLPPQKYDMMVGLYLFHRQSNLGGVIDLGDDRVDPGLLGEGWARRRPCGDAGVCRGLDGRARVFAPLDVPQDLAVTIRAAGSGALRVALNSRELGVLPLRGELADYRLTAPAGYWRRELNEIVLDPESPPDVIVEHLRFERLAR